jgi:hypothetical protein
MPARWVTCRAILAVAQRAITQELVLDLRRARPVAVAPFADPIRVDAQQPAVWPSLPVRRLARSKSLGMSISAAVGSRFGAPLAPAGVECFTVANDT